MATTRSTSARLSHRPRLRGSAELGRRNSRDGQEPPEVGRRALEADRTAAEVHDFEWDVLNTPIAETADGVVARKAGALLKELGGGAQPFFWRLGFAARCAYAAPQKNSSTSTRPVSIRQLDEPAASPKPSPRGGFHVSARHAAAAVHASGRKARRRTTPASRSSTRRLACCWRRSTSSIFGKTRLWCSQAITGITWASTAACGTRCRFSSNRRRAAGRGLAWETAPANPVRGWSSWWTFIRRSSICVDCRRNDLAGHSLRPLLKDPAGRWSEAAYTQVRHGDVMG